eukprot:TRINITY_DN24128_c0_g1_i1.p1 TRINITY_DN24128_c0_g1~~TRINITY_DN24128_c0_g1_i1.p1  ORF type:complete len:156 (+),score=25.06 TRINITY_DN24128_c0_g1_i1:68-535(+)
MVSMSLPVFCLLAAASIEGAHAVRAGVSQKAAERGAPLLKDKKVKCRDDLELCEDCPAYLGMQKKYKYDKNGCPVACECIEKNSFLEDYDPWASIKDHEKMQAEGKLPEPQTPDVTTPDPDEHLRYSYVNDTQVESFDSDPEPCDGNPRCKEDDW